MRGHLFPGRQKYVFFHSQISHAFPDRKPTAAKLKLGHEHKINFSLSCRAADAVRPGQRYQRRPRYRISS